VALLVVAAGMIAGSIFENTIVGSCLAAWGTVLKGWSDFKKFPIKVDRCQFAYTTYAKILTELRTYARGIPFNEDSFLVKMQTFLASLQPEGSAFCLRMFSSTYVECVTRSFEAGCSSIVCPMTMFVTLLLSY